MEEFLQITGCEDADLAQSILESCSQNLEVAVSRFFELMGDGEVAPPAPINGNSRAASSSSSASADPPQSSSSSFGGDSQGVRAPLEHRVEQLVPTGSSGGVSGPLHIPQVATQFRDFGRESQAQRGRGGGGGKGGRGLDALFKPPTELIFPGTYEQVRAAAKAQHRWMLVNIQLDEDFASWRYNRDVWCDEVVAMVVSSSFVFWQQHWAVKDATGAALANMHAQEFARKHGIRMEDLPCVCIVDPRTGELVLIHYGGMDAPTMTEKLTDWVTSHPLSDGRPIDRVVSRSPTRHSAAPQRSGSSSAPSSRAPDVHHLGAVVDEEEAAIAAAIAASLGEAAAGPRAPALPAAPRPSGPALPVRSPHEDSPISIRRGTRPGDATASGGAGALGARRPAPAARAAFSHDGDGDLDGGDLEGQDAVVCIDDEEDGDGGEGGVAEPPARRFVGANDGGEEAPSSSSSAVSRPGAAPRSQATGSGNSLAGGKRGREAAGRDAAAAAAAAVDNASDTGGPTPSATPQKLLDLLLGLCASSLPPAPAAAPQPPAAASAAATALLSSWLAEPPPSAPLASVTRLQVRLPNGSPVVRRVWLTAPVAMLFAVAASLHGQPHPVAGLVCAAAAAAAAAADSLSTAASPSSSGGASLGNPNGGAAAHPTLAQLSKAAASLGLRFPPGAPSTSSAAAAAQLDLAPPLRDFTDVLALYATTSGGCGSGVDGASGVGPGPAAMGAWDLQRAHPLLSLSAQEALGDTVGGAGLASTSLRVQAL